MAADRTVLAGVRAPRGVRPLPPGRRSAVEAGRVGAAAHLAAGIGEVDRRREGSIPEPSMHSAAAPGPGAFSPGLAGACDARPKPSGGSPLPDTSCGRWAPSPMPAGTSAGPGRTAAHGVGHARVLLSSNEEKPKTHSGDYENNQEFSYRPGQISQSFHYHTQDATEIEQSSTQIAPCLHPFCLIVWAGRRIHRRSLCRNVSLPMFFISFAWHLPSQSRVSRPNGFHFRARDNTADNGAGKSNRKSVVVAVEQKIACSSR